MFTLNVATGGGGGGVPRACAIASLAAAVPSAPQTGQATVVAIRPFTGSTSKAYFWPHAHWIFMGIIGRVGLLAARTVDEQNLAST